jgi:Short-chain dehydrogenases of various substrate specificities
MNLDEFRSLYDFSCRTVLVTGGTGVLAWEIVTALARCNANMVVLGRNHDQGSMLVKKLSNQ